MVRCDNKPKNECRGTEEAPSVTTAITMDQENNFSIHSVRSLTESHSLLICSLTFEANNIQLKDYPTVNLGHLPQEASASSAFSGALN